MYPRTAAPCEDSDQTAHLRSQIRIYTGAESTLGAFWTAKDARFLHADNEESSQIAQMRRLIWVVARACQTVRFNSYVAPL